MVELNMPIHTHSHMLTCTKVCTHLGAASTLGEGQEEGHGQG